MNFLDSINIVSDEEYAQRLEQEKKEKIKSRSIHFEKLIPKGLANTDTSRLDSKAVDLARQWAEDPNRKLNFFLHGNTGVGKTRLSWLILKRMFSVFHITSNAIGAESLARRLLNERFLMDECTRAHLLLFDDIGKERGTPTAESAIFELIRERMDRQKPTIYTSNYSIDELVDRFNKQETGTAIARRLVESSQCVEMH